MKQCSFILIVLMVVCSAFAKAQRGIRVAYIDMDYILEQVPEYQTAVKNLDIKMAKWKTEMDRMDAEIDKLKENLKNERILLTPELIEEKEEEILLKEEDLLTYQQKRFGAEQGDYILQRKQLIEPLQSQVFNEVQKISAAKKYDYVMNADDVTMLYAAERHDISDDVLKAIGRTGKKKSRKERIKEAEEESKPERYLSVQEAEKKDKLTEEKEAKIAARNSEKDARTRKRDSARAAKKAAFEERKRILMERKQRRRDSILEVREEARRKKAAAREKGN